jgi:hypothetical protein
LPSTPAAAVTSLIVVSKDLGELAFARWLLRGQQFAARTLVALPEDLFATHRAAVPTAAMPYGSREDVLELARSHQPDLVFLFSASLLALEGPLFRQGVRRLLEDLERQGCRVITSDPFAGLGPSLTVGDLDTRMIAPGQPRLRRWLLRAVLRLQKRSARAMWVPGLERAIHLYPTSIPEANDGVERLSVFNPATLRPAGGPVTESTPRWLFVMSPRDLHVQLASNGVRGLTEWLLGMMRHTIESDALPTLVAPEPVIRRLESAVPPGTELLSDCPMPAFEERVLGAEYVFYWNAFSFSQMARLVNEKPVFYLDRGLSAHVIKPFYQRARATHFGGWEPTYVDQRQLFSRYVLAHLAKAQQPVFRALRERWQASPTPDEVVARLGHREPTPTAP